MKNKITAENISYAFDISSTKVFQDLSFEIPGGNIFSIIGMNGSGKTTILKTLLGYYPPTEGKIIFQQDENNYQLSEIRGLIGYLPQNEQVPLRMNANDYISLGRMPFLSIFGMPVMDEPKIILGVIRDLGITELRFTPLGEMSGGELQRVRLARALIQEPKIILFDEPTTHLDISNKKAIFSMMEKLRRKEKIIVFSSNEPNEALKYSDFTLIVDNNSNYIFGRTKKVITSRSINKFFKVKSEITKIHGEDIIYYL